MKRIKYVPFLFAAVCTAIYVSLIFNNNLWLDEAFSASIIRCGFDEMVSKTFADTLPPFYNFAAWGFTRIFGYSTLSLKIFSILPMTALMLVSAVFIPRIASVRSACIYIVLITAMPHFLEYGIEIRMYGWAVFFASSAAVFALCAVKGVRYADIGIIVSTVFGAYTHQYALIAESLVWLALLVISIRNRTVKRWLIMAAVCVMAYIPCAVLTLFQMKAAASYFSAEPVTFGSMMASVRYPFVTDVTVLSAFLMGGVIILIYLSISQKSYMLSFLMISYLLEILLSFGIMVFTGSTFFTSRYLMPALGMLWLGAALILDEALLKRRILWAFATPIVVFTLITGYIKNYKAEYVDTSEFEAFIDSTDSDDGYLMIEAYPEIEICLEYYAPWLKKYEVDQLDEISGNKYLLVNGDVHTDDIEKIKSKGYEIHYKENYCFDRYTFKAYVLNR